MDVTGAFLYGDINESVFMSLSSGQTCELKKSIYGLKKSPRYWNQKFNDFILSENFVQSKNEPCLYVKFQNNQPIFYVMIYVDDLLLFSNNDCQMQKFKSVLCNTFKMKS